MNNGHKAMRAAIYARCSTDENRQDVSTQLSADARDDGIEVREEEVCRVVGPSVMRRPGHRMLEEVAQVEGVAALPKQDHATLVRQGIGVEGDMELPQASGHLPQCYHDGNFVGRSLYRR